MTKRQLGFAYLGCALIVFALLVGCNTPTEQLLICDLKRELSQDRCREALVEEKMTFLAGTDYDECMERSEGKFTSCCERVR
jgi:hypothetical protein